MEQELPWYVDRLDNLGAEIDRNEISGSLAEYVIENLIAEGTRRGIQQGKREAWEEALKLEIPKRAFASDAGYRMACKHFTDWLEAKLASLDNSSKE